MSSTAVTPSDVWCSITGGEHSPRYEPRSSGGTPGWSLVRPRTCASYRTVSCHGIRGRRSSPQSNHGFTTTDLDVYGAESTSESGPRAGCQRMVPDIANAYGSSSNFEGCC